VSFFVPFVSLDPFSRQRLPVNHLHPATYLRICVTWLIHMCDMTHAYVWRGSFVCEMKDTVHVTLMHMCDVTHSYVWHDSCMCDATQSYVRWKTLSMSHSCICVTWIVSCICVTWKVSFFSHMNESYHTYCICVTWIVSFFVPGVSSDPFFGQLLPTNSLHPATHGVATVSRIDKIICLFCRIVSFIGLFCKRDL